MENITIMKKKDNDNNQKKTHKIYLLLVTIVLCVFVLCPMIYTIYNRGVTTYSLPQENVQTLSLNNGDVLQQEICLSGKKLKAVRIICGSELTGTNQVSMDISYDYNGMVYTEKKREKININGWTNIDITPKEVIKNTDKVLIIIKNAVITDDNGNSWPIFVLAENENIYENPCAVYNGDNLAGPCKIDYDMIDYSNKFGNIITFILVVGLMILINIYIVFKPKDNQKGLYILCTVLIFAMMNFYYPFFGYKGEGFAEGVYDFYKTAAEKGFIENLFTLEAGFYLSFFQRIVTYIVVRILRMRELAMVAMQLISLFFVSCSSSLICLPRFKKYIEPHLAVLLSIVFAMGIIPYVSSWFITVGYYGIFWLMYLWCLPLEKMKTSHYMGICIVTVLICLSKMMYVVLIPICVVFLFHYIRDKNKRRSIYVTVLMAACFLEYFLTRMIQNMNHNIQVAIQIDGMGNVINETVYYTVQLIRNFLFKGNVNPLVTNILILIMLLLVMGICVIVFLKQDRDRCLQAGYVMGLFGIVGASVGVSVLSGLEGTNGVDWSKNIDVSMNQHFFFAILALYCLVIMAIYWLSAKKFIREWFMFLVTFLIVCTIDYMPISMGWDQLVSDERYVTGDWKSYCKVLEDDAYGILVWVTPGDYRWYLKNSEVEEISIGKDYTADVQLSDVEKITEIYIEKYPYTNQILNKEVEVCFLDDSGTELYRVPQLNASTNRLYLGYRIDEEISHVSKVAFVDKEGKPIYITNKIFVVRKTS